jgi:4-amino-4-deoxy-L-arabinose transferase-like glycosyltransferase
MTRIFQAIALLLVACRFYAFRTDLDHPHLFRQAETAFYSLGFFRFGMNIFQPTVGWLGSSGHVILEFPLTEWIAAALYQITGPTVLVDRLVNLAFFLGSAMFLHRTVTLVQDRTLAWFVTIVYLAAPLGIYYSRAVHVDFTAVCFGHALVYFAVRFAGTRRARDAGAAAGAGVLAFLIKAPYAFFLIAPVLAWCRLAGAARRIWIGVAAIFAGAAIVFLGWFAYTQRVNAQAADLSVIPSYFAQVNRFGWFFGTLGDRWSVEIWRTVVGNIYREIGSTVWWAAVPLALLARDRLRGFHVFALAWTAGAAVYLVLFLTLNAMHNYYQIPVIAPFALWLGAACYGVWTIGGDERRAPRIVAVALVAAYAVTSFVVATQRFYRTDPLNLAIGQFVNAQTTDEDLVVMAYTPAAYADPSFLFYARRFGWSVGHQELSPEIIRTLAAHGATAVVTSTLWPVGREARAYLDGQPLDGALDIGGGTVWVHRLASPTGKRGQTPFSSE